MTALPSLFGELRGSIGASVFARNQYGPYERKRTTPKNTASTLKTRVKNHWKRLVIRWQDRLTAAQRQGWNEYAACSVVHSKFSPRAHLSGFNMFYRANMPRVFTTMVALHDPPTSRGVIQWTSPFDIDDSFTGFVFFSLNTADAWAADVGAAMFIQISRVKTSAVNFGAGPWRRADDILATVGGVPAANAMVDPWTPFVAPDRRWMRAYVMTSDGRVTAPRIFAFTDNT